MSLKNAMESKIKNHCDNLRNQIDLSTESTSESLNKYRVEMLNKVKKFETGKIYNMKQHFKNNYNEPFVILMNEFAKLKF